jgi:CubicO group peptidase (beta-lactamase class C family)
MSSKMRMNASTPNAFALASLRRVLGCLLMLAYVNVSWAQIQPKAQESKPANVEAFLGREMQKRRIPGLQVAVIRHGKIVLFRSYGLANVEYAIPVRNDTVFSIHSATKAFTGVAVMQLVESGQLDLNAPIATYVDRLPTPWQAVTPRQLLTHVSGLPNVVDMNTGKLIVDGNEAAAWAKVQTLPMEFAPGERFSYNQTNYLVLGLALSRITGKSVTDVITEGQFHAAKMPHSRFGDSRDVLRNKAQSYSYSRLIDGKFVTLDTASKVYAEVPAFLYTAGGIDTTAEELARWIVALQQGQLLKAKDSLSTLWTPGVLNDGSRSPAPGGPAAGYALGWQIDSYRGHRIVGGTGGARSAFFIYPDDDLAVVLLTNLQGAMPESFIHDVAGYFLPNLSAATPRAVIK